MDVYMVVGGFGKL